VYVCSALDFLIEKYGVLLAIKTKQTYRLVMVAYIYNISYSGGRDQEDHGSRPAEARSLQDPISINKQGVVVCTCDPSYTGDINWRIMI
jgi:hypothetical protein